MTTPWRWEYHHYDPKTERLVESLCTLGNGRFATRGSAPECLADDIHCPGTYLAGCYDRLTSRVAGPTVVNEDMVRLPDWTALRYRCLPDDAERGDWLTPDHPSLRHCHVSLNLRAGTLTRRMLFHDAEGRRLAATPASSTWETRAWPPSGPSSGRTAGAARSRSNPCSTATSPTRVSTATAPWTGGISSSTGRV